MHDEITLAYSGAKYFIYMFLVWGLNIFASGIVGSHDVKLCQQFDIIAISETWVSEPEHNKFNINGYDVYHTNRKNKRGGGVALC